MKTTTNPDVGGPVGERGTTQEVERAVAEALASGAYATASEAILEGLRLLAESGRQRRELLDEIGIGIGQAERGELVPFDEALVERVKSAARAWFAILRGR